MGIVPRGYKLTIVAICPTQIEWQLFFKIRDSCQRLYLLTGDSPLGFMGDTDIIIPLKMNGSDTPWKTWTFTDKTEQTASFWPGELRPGENAFAITSEQNGFVYDYMDIRLTGLAAGLTIIFR